MTDKTQVTSEPLDFELEKAIRSLDQEIQPQRDLWAGIERKIAQHPQRRKVDWKYDWMPYGVAASLVIAVSTLVMNLYQVQPLNSQSVSFDQSMWQLQDEYRQVISPMVQEFEEVNKALAPATLQELYRNIEIMEQARRDIEEQVRKNPGNQRLVEKLMWIHEQEMKLLKRDYSHAVRTL